MVTDPGILNKILRTFTDCSITGIANLEIPVQTLIWALSAMELTLVALWWAYGGSEALGRLVKKMLFLMLFVAIINNYGSILTIVQSSFVAVGEKAAGSQGPLIDDPSGIMEKGFDLTNKLFELADNRMSFYDVGSWIDAAFILLTVLIIFAAYFLLAVQVLITRVEFSLIATLGFVFVPLAAFKPTSFMAEKVFGAVISFGVKLMVLSYIITIGFPLISEMALPGDPSWFDQFYTMVAALGLAVLALHAPGVAAGLLVGSPTLTAGSAVSGAVAGSALVGGAAYAGYSTPSAIRGARQIGDAGASLVGKAAGALGSALAPQVTLAARALAAGASALSVKGGTGGGSSGEGANQKSGGMGGGDTGAGGASGSAAQGNNRKLNFAELRAQKQGGQAPDQTSGGGVGSEKEAGQENSAGGDRGAQAGSNTEKPAHSESYLEERKASQGDNKKSGKGESPLRRVVNAYQVTSSVLDRTAHPSGGVVVPIRPHED